MADTQSLSDASHTESVGESILTGLTPRDVQQFIKRLVALNNTLKRQLAAVNQDIVERRGNSENNASTESVVHSPVQASGQSNSYPPADQSPLQPSTLASSQSYTTPVQTESEADEVFGPVLEEWQQRFQGLESVPGTTALPQHNSYLHRELEHCRTENNELLGHHNNLLRLYTTRWQRHSELKDHYRQQLVSYQNQVIAANRERDDSRAGAAEAQQRLQSDIDRLNGRIRSLEENLQDLGQEKAALQQRVTSLLTEKQHANDEYTKKITELNTLNEEKQHLLAEDGNKTRIIASVNETLMKLTDDHKALVEEHTKALKEISALSEQLKDVQDSRDEELRFANAQHAERERLEHELNAAKVKYEQLQNDTKPTSLEEQTKSMTQLKIKNRELELKLDELRKSKDVMQTMLENNTSKVVEIQLKDQLDDLRAMLKACEDLARARGETIENMKREHSRNVESSEAYRTLRQQCDTYKNSLDVERKNLETVSAEIKELTQRITDMQSKLEETTEERDNLRLTMMRQRHNPPPDTRMSYLVPDANTGNAAAGAAGAATLPATHAQPLRVEPPADRASPHARTGTRQSAVQTPANTRPSASTQPTPFRLGPPSTYRCQFCNAQHPDHDSRFVHEKDCPKRPFYD